MCCFFLELLFPFQKMLIILGKVILETNKLSAPLLDFFHHASSLCFETTCPILFQPTGDAKTMLGSLLCCPQALRRMMGTEDGDQDERAMIAAGKCLAHWWRPVHLREQRAWGRYWWPQNPLASGVWCLLPHWHLFPQCFPAPSRAPGLTGCCWG